METRIISETKPQISIIATKFDFTQFGDVQNFYYNPTMNYIISYSSQNYTPNMEELVQTITGSRLDVAKLRM